MGYEVPASSDTIDLSDLVGALRDRAPKLAVGVAAAQAAWSVTKDLRTRARKRSTYTIKVPASDDVLYDGLHAWVLGLLAPREQRALVALSSKRSRYDILPAPDSTSCSAAPPSLRLYYDSSREQVVMVAGHKVKVVVDDNKEGGGNQNRLKVPEIVFTVYSLAAREALLAEMEAVLLRSHQAKHRPSFRMLDKWGDWAPLDYLPARSLDSVILPPGQLERLIADVERFLACEQEYARRAAPWHRGLLFEGEPGTGKTATALAIACYFGMDIWYMPLADVRKDSELLQTVTRVSPRSMLLLEDIDVFHAATQRDDDADITLSGLLNTLDGIGTPHGLLTVLTTNTPEVLDRAVVRAGRVDLVEHFGLAEGDQVTRLVAHWYGAQIPGTEDICGIAPAEVTEVCKRHDDPARAVTALQDMASHHIRLQTGHE